MYRLKQNALG